MRKTDLTGPLSLHPQQTTPENQGAAAPRAPKAGIALIAAALLGLGTGCLDQLGLGTPDTPELAKPGKDLLVSGDLPGAAAKFEELGASNPKSVHVAVGRAYTLLLAGDYGGADSVLAGAEEAAAADPKLLSEIKLRRALVALRNNELDDVKKHGSDSGLPEGKLLAAEVHLVDLESDQASSLFKEIQNEPTVVGETAQKYIALLESGNQYQVGLAEATALWALGVRSDACQTAEEVLSELDTPDKNEQLLIWAGRAVTSDNPGVARTLLDQMEFPPEGQAWRKTAVDGMIAVAEGDNERGLMLFSALADAGAPADGLADARATAASLTSDKEVCKQLIGNVESAAAARSLLDCGAAKLATGKAPEGTPLKNYLRSR